MGTAIRKTAEKSSEKLFKPMKFRTIPNFRLTDLSLYHIIVLLGHGAFVLRARTPSLHQRVVLHDKGPGGVLPPRDVILAHEIIAQRRSVSKAQQSVRLLERHLFDEIERPVLRRQKYANMPDKQQRSLLGRLIMEEYTHTTGDMQRRAAEIVGEFLADIFGEELRPWEENGKMEKELSA